LTTSIVSSSYLAPPDFFSSGNTNEVSQMSNRDVLAKGHIATLYNAAFVQALDNLRLEFKSSPFSPSTAEDVVQNAVHYCETQRSNNRSYKYAQKFKDAIQPLDRFLGAIDKGVSSNTVAGIIWGCLRFVIVTVSILGQPQCRARIYAVE
jgi:hypothetical protein